MDGKIIRYNAAIFPSVMEFKLEPTDGTSGCSIELPRGVCHLYLSNLNPCSDAREIELFEKYASGLSFVDSDYEDIIEYVFVPIPRPSGSGDIRDRMLEKFGIRLMTDGKKQWFEILNDHIPEIRANTWDCILVR